MDNSVNLEHSGILGQKWGVRNYQNYDGSLTEAGRARYHKSQSSIDKIINKALDRANTSINSTIENYQSDIQWALKEVGVKRYKNYDKVTNNKNLYRMANDEKVDDKRKYVSVTNKDRSRYQDYAADHEIWADDDKDLYEYTYKTKKSLKVKKPESFVSEYFDEVYSKPTIQKAGEAFILNIQGIDRIRANFRDQSEEQIEKAKKQGYDAIVDMEDYSGAAAYPLVILNPKDSIKTKSKNKILPGSGIF